MNSQQNSSGSTGTDNQQGNQQSDQQNGSQGSQDSSKSIPQENTKDQDRTEAMPS